MRLTYKTTFLILYLNLKAESIAENFATIIFD